MAYQPTAISDDLKNLPKLPAWVTTGRVETLETVAFRSGAALMVLDQLVSDPSKGVPLKLLANRLALATATQTSKLEGRLAQEADIRDAYHLVPAGDLLAFWRDAARLRLISKDCSADLKECVGSNFKDDVAGLIEAVVSHAKTHGPLAGCVAVVRAVLEADDRSERLACLLTDVVLSRVLNWKTVLTISTLRLTKAVLQNLVALVHELIEAQDERRLQRMQKQLTSQNLLIIDELGFVPLSKSGAELLFEVISQCYERGSIIITSNLPFDEWTEVFGSERLTGALLDRLTHHVHILEMNGESYRLKHSRKARQ